MAEAAISVRHLVKSFGAMRALDGLNLSVDPGEVHGFLGPNGAGKSTTIRVLLGLLRAERGCISVLGHDPWSDAVILHRRLAYVPGDVTLWPELTGGEAIDLLGRFRGSVNARRRTMLCERFSLDPTKKARTYSKGNRQKVAIIAALASSVDLYILDEPTSGLDPLMEITFQECIAEEKAEGKTILLSSHILAQVEALSDRVTIIRQGRTVESGTLQELRHLTRTSFTVEADRPMDDVIALPVVHNARSEADGRVHFDVDSDHIDAVVNRMAHLGVRSLVSQPPTLEQLFMRHYGDGNADATNRKARP
jgi:ABC-2 type transport system ATP-binding protein